MSGNTHTNYNKWKATKIYGNFEVLDLVDQNSNIIDPGIITCNDIVFNNSMNGISTSIFSYLSNLTGDIQTQINYVKNRLIPSITYNSGTNTTTLMGNFVFSGVARLNNISATTFSYLANASSDIQTQLNNITKNYISNS